MTVFHEPWWLDAVAEDQWDEARLEEDGRCVGRWPYVLRRGPGPLVRILSPPLSPRLGPILDPVLDPREDLGEWSDALVALADRLPRHHQFLQRFDPAVQYWIPLSWRGFSATTLFSFVIDDTSDLDAVRQGYSRGTRGHHRKGSRLLSVREDQPTGPLYAAWKATLDSAGTKVGYPAATLARAVEEASARDRGVHMSCHSAGGDYLAGAFFVWDDKTVYYLVGAATAEARGTSAQTVLVDRGIEIASERGLRFDFEGSRVQGIERFFRGFGSTPEPFMRVERRTRAVNLLLTVREAARRSESAINS